MKLAKNLDRLGTESAFSILAEAKNIKTLEVEQEYLKKMDLLLMQDQLSSLRLI